MSEVILVTKDTYESEVEQASKLVVIDFFSPWCPPCKAMEPVLKEIAAENADGVKIVKIDASEEPDIAKKFDIRSAPTFVAIRNGEKVDAVSGIRSKQFMLDWINNADL